MCVIPTVSSPLPIYAYIYIHTYIHIYIYIYICMYVCIYVYTCIYMYTNTSMYTNSMYMCIGNRTHTCAHTHACCYYHRCHDCYYYRMLLLSLPLLPLWSTSFLVHEVGRAPLDALHQRAGERDHEDLGNIIVAIVVSVSTISSSSSSRIVVLLESLSLLYINVITMWCHC